jgi:WD40 repeat protein
LVVIAVSLAAATTQYRKAGSRGQVARSRELAAAAIGAVPTDPGGGLKLAVAAVRAEPTTEAQSALRRVLFSPVQAILRPQSGLAAGVEFTRDGRLALTWGESGARLWRTADGDPEAKLVGSGSHDRTNDASFDPTGKYIVTGGRDGTVRMFDVKGRERWISADHGHVDDVVFSPDGRLVISNSEEGRMRVRRASNGRVISVLPTLAVSPTTASISRDGRLVVTAGYDGVVRVWSVAHSRLVRVLRLGGSAVVTTAIFADNGRRVLTVREDGTAAVWRLEDSRPMTILGVDVTGAGVTGDSSLIVTATKRGVAALWRARDGKRLRVLRGPGSRVSTAPFTASGRTVALGAGSAVRVFDVVEGTTVDVLHPAEGVPIVDPSGGLVATARESGEVQLWRVRRKAKSVILKHSDRRVEDAFFSPNGGLIVTLANGRWIEDEDLGEAWLWQADGRRVRRLIGGRNGGFTDAVFDPTGRRVALGGGSGRTALVSLDGGSRLLPGNGDVVNRVRFSPDGGMLAAAGDDGSVRLWRLPSGRQRVLPPPLPGASTGSAPSLTAIAFSPDGTRLVSGDIGGTIRLWSIRGSSSGGALQSRFGSVNSLAFNRDGRSLVAGYERGGAVLWNIERKAATATLPVPGEADGVADARFSPDDASIATASTGTEGVVRLWRTNDGHAMPPALVGAKSWLTRLAFSPNSEFVAASGGDGAVRVWDLTNHLPLMSERPSGEPINSVAWSPNGRVVLTAGDDGTARLWRCEPCAPLGVLLARAERQLQGTHR